MTSPPGSNQIVQEGEVLCKTGGSSTVHGQGRWTPVLGSKVDWVHTHRSGCGDWRVRHRLREGLVALVPMLKVVARRIVSLLRRSMLAP
jgi:hypothetical protein